MQAPGIEIDDLRVGLRDIEQMKLKETPVGEGPFKSFILGVELDNKQIYNFSYTYYKPPPDITEYTRIETTNNPNELAQTITETMQSNRNSVQVEGNINDTSRVFDTHFIKIFPLFLFKNRIIANKLYTEYVKEPAQLIGKMRNPKYKLKSAEEKLEYICYAATYWVIMVPDETGQVKLHTPEGIDQTDEKAFRHNKFAGYKFVKINNPLQLIKGGSGSPVSAYILAGLSVVLGCAMLSSFVKP